MIFNTIYTITIGEFAIMQKLENPNLIKRINIWIPEKMVKKAYSKLISKHNINYSPNKIKELTTEGFDRLGVGLEIERYEILYKIVQIWYQLYGEPKKKAKEYIDKISTDLFGKPLEEKEFEKIVKKRTLLIEKAQQVFGDGKEDDEKIEYNFEKDVIRLEKYYPNIRQQKLYTLPDYVELLKERIENEQRN
jgi:hypothetical protein